MANPPGGFIWYELMTTDPDGAAAFYGAVVGWTIAGQAGAASAGGPDYRHITRADGGANGGVMGLTAEMQAGGARPGWLNYLHVQDVDAAVRAITADGGALLMPVFDIEVGRIGMVADPQGIAFYVMKPVPPAGREAVPNDVFDRWTDQHISWNELYTPDLDGAKAFYAKHFDFAFNEAMPMGEMGDYAFIDHGGETIGAMMRTPPGAPSGWNFYIRVPRLDTAIEAVNAGGGSIVNGPMEVPGGEWIVNGLDPQGAPFSLVAKER